MEEYSKNEVYVAYQQIFSSLSQELINDYKYYDDVDILYRYIKSHFSSHSTRDKSTRYIDLKETVELMSSHLVIGQVWATGGSRGGSYGTSSETYTLSVEEAKPSMPFILESFLEVVAPDLTLVEYRKMLEANPIVYTETSKSDYYNNSTDYVIKYIDMSKTFDYLYDHCLLLENSKLKEIADSRLANAAQTLRKSNKKSTV